MVAVAMLCAATAMGHRLDGGECCLPLAQRLHALGFSALLDRIEAQ